MTSISTEVELELGDETPTALYRFYAKDGRLLYVGITNDMKTRLKQHAAEKQWWSEVARKTVAWFPARSEALAAESAAIRDEQPVYNIAGAGRGFIPVPARQDAAAADARYEGWPADDPFPDGLGSWCRTWWYDKDGGRAAPFGQLDSLDLFGAALMSAIEAFGNWYIERKHKEAAYHIAWVQADDHSKRPRRTWSAHADTTCASDLSRFTKVCAAVQQEFLEALVTAGRCTEVRSGRQAVALGFTDKTEAQIVGAVLSDVFYGRTSIAEKCVAALTDRGAA